MNKISIFGTGYVGLVSAVCLADLGNRVICVDIDEEKLHKLKNGQVPFYEPGLEDLIIKNSNNLEFTSDAAYAVESSDIIFIAVGTPQNDNGSCNLNYIYSVADTISRHMKTSKIIVIKSTVPVGTGEEVEKIISRKYKGDFDVTSNPEFLKEGSAISDFMNPDRIVIGSSSIKAARQIGRLYKPLNAKIVMTNRESSELIKYAANAFLATKISFINSVANLAEKVQANIIDVAEGIGLDKRIGPMFLKAGIGYGGSCFPKDVRALLHLSKHHNEHLEILESVDRVNEKQKSIPVKKLRSKIDLSISKIAVLGLSFKPDTDDIREAPSLVIIKELLNEGAEVWAWDPLSEEACQKIIPQVHYCPTPYEAVTDAHAAIIVTEWNHLKILNLPQVKRLMKYPLIIDGRNLLNKKRAIKHGIEYQGIGV